MTAVLWSLVLLPALAGAGFLLLGRRAERAAGPVAVLTATTTLVLAVGAAVGRPAVSVPAMAGSSWALAVDGLAALLAPTVSAVTLAVLVFAAADVRRARARFHGLMLLFAAAALATVLATTLPTLLAAWEVMGATSYALIGFGWRTERRVASGLTAFLTTRTADLGLYLAAAAAVAGGAGLGLSTLPAATPGWRDVAAAGVLVAALGKAAQLPFSFWLSRAMDGPSPVSALLHSAAMVALGGYLLLRAEPLLAATGWAATTAAWVGATTALVLGAVAVVQTDLKQLLAASTSAQLGFVVLAAGAGATAGGAAHLVAHAATKALLFLVAGAWLSALGTRRLDALRGAARLDPLVGAAATLGGLSLAGVAPLALWATKDAVLAGAFAASPALYVVALAAAGLSAAYAGRMLVLLWRPRAEAAPLEEEEAEATLRVGVLERLALVPLAAGAAVLGLLALPPVGERVRRLVGSVGEATPSWPEVLLGTVLALAVLGAVARWWPRLERTDGGLLREWLGLERAAHAVVVGPVLALASRLAVLDDRGIDRAVSAVAGATLRAADRAAAFDTGVVDGAVEALVRGSRRLGELARRPQTGQLHQYYIQAVAVLATAALVLVVVR